MGGYLGRAHPRPPPPTVSSGDPLRRPSPRVHRVPQALQVHSMGKSLDLAGSLSFDDRATLPHPHQHPQQVMVVHEPRYPVEQARHLLLGGFSSVFLSGQQNSVQAVPRSRESRRSVILQVASTKSKDILRLVLGQPILIIWSFLTGHLSAPSRKQTRIRALEKLSQVQVKEKKDLTALGEGREGFVKQEEGLRVTERLSDQGRDPGGSVSAPSAFRRLIVNGVLSSFIPRPGPLNRDFCNKNSANSLVKEYQAAFESSCSKRNAIASSYSSSVAQWPQARNRAAAAVGAAAGAPGLSHPASLQFQEPAKETNEKGRFQPSSPCSLTGKERKANHENITAAPQGQQGDPRNDLLSAEMTRPVRRKIPLLLPCRREVPIILPLRPELSFQVTTEDLDLEKRAAMQWINKVLNDDGAKAQCS